MLASLTPVDFTQLGEQISENAALVLANIETEGGNSQGNQNGQGNQDGNSQGGGGRGGSGGGGPTQPPKPEEPDGTFTWELVYVGNAPFGSSYPPLTVVESRQELEAYYNEYNQSTGMPGFGTLDDGRGYKSFREAMDSHDDAYFEKNVLAIVWAHTYGNYFESVDVDFDNSVIHIERKSLGGFLDVSHWHFLFGLPKKNVKSVDFTLSLTDE